MSKGFMSVENVTYWSASLAMEKGWVKYAFSFHFYSIIKKLYDETA